ncbi:MAG: NAD-dependent epimerase/dehydratase family protein [Bacteroidota bacterium]
MDVTINKGNKTALLLGGSGLVGSFCLQHLLASPIYEKVVSFGRRELDMAHEKLTQHVIDFDEVHHYQKLFQGDDLFCCLGTNIKKAGSKTAFRKVDFHYPLQIAEMAAWNKVGQFILVSSAGADSDALIFYSKVKGELEEAIKDLSFWGIHIMQPAVLLGERKESRPLERFGMIVSQGLNYLVGDMLGKYQPVNAEDVALAMIAVAQDLQGGHHVYPSDKIVKLGRKGSDLIR